MSVLDNRLWTSCSFRLSGIVPVWVYSQQTRYPSPAVMWAHQLRPTKTPDPPRPTWGEGEPSDANLETTLLTWSWASERPQVPSTSWMLTLSSIRQWWEADCFAFGPCRRGEHCLQLAGEARHTQLHGQTSAPALGANTWTTAKH